MDYSYHNIHKYKHFDTLSESNILAQAEKANPALVKYLKRVFKEGLNGLDAVREAMRRFEEARRSEGGSLEKALSPSDKDGRLVKAAQPTVGSYRNTDKQILELRRKAGPGIWEGDGFSAFYGSYLGQPSTAALITMSSPLAGLINSMPTIINNLHHTTVIGNSQAVHKKEGQHKASPRVK